MPLLLLERSPTCGMPGRYSSAVQDSLEADWLRGARPDHLAKDRFALSREPLQHEPCWYAARGTASWHGDRKQTTLWHINAREDGHGPGTQKPVECNSSSVRWALSPFRIRLPKSARWKEEFVAELLAFPGRHDDQVDALTQGLAWGRQQWSRKCYVGHLKGLY